MKSMKQMNSRHSNMGFRHSNIITFNTTSLARRVLLLLSLFVMSVGSAWGAETTIWEGSSRAEVSASDITAAFGSSTEIILRVYGDLSSGDIYIASLSYQKFLDKDDYTSSDDAYDIAGYLQFELNSAMITQLENQGLVVQAQNGATLTKITWDVPAPDVFEGSAKSESVSGTDITKYLTTETQLTLDITKATAKLGGTAAKYARFYVLHNGVAENLKTNTTLLEISGVTPAAQVPQKGIYGNYLYNSGNDLDLSGLTVKLNASAGEFPDYQVVCLLSTDAAKAATGNVVSEEPDWDVVFTYSFRNQTVTKNQVGTVAWDAIAMSSSIPTTDIATNWGTSWANLAQEQKIEWYVVDGSDNVQPLAIGSDRQDDTWTINLPSPFAVTSNVAILTGQNTYTAATFEEQWAQWGNPAVYAPANKSFADVQDYKIICKIADDGNALAVPNVVYTLSLTNVLNGQEKTGMTKTTTQVKLAAATDVTKDIDITLPAGTKYARFYVVDEDGTALDATDAAHKLTVTDGKTYTDNTLGYYVYNASGLSLSSVTFSSSSADLDNYEVIMVTSAETAVNTSGTVTYEPDYETQTTFWFNYPATAWNTEANVEWSPQSMQIASPDIETNKGTGYLTKNQKHYTMQWYVKDDNGVKNLLMGNSRVNDYWSINVSSNPFTIEANKAVVTNNANIGVVAWEKWAAPQFYAPKNATIAELAAKHTHFICEFYEDDDASDANMLAMTYTVYIDKTEKTGQLKDGGKRGGETLTPSGNTVTIDLTAATTAFATEIGGTPTYARVYLEKTDGTLIDPTTALTGLTGYQTFQTAANGYYNYNESGITLPANAQLTLTEGQFNYYHVVVCLSGDKGEDSHIGTSQLSRSLRAATVTDYYESDYDFIYTIKFTELSDFPGNLDNLLKSHSKEVLVKSTDTEVVIPLNETKTVNKFVKEMGKADFATLVGDYFHVRWFVAKKNSDGTYEKVNGSETMLDPVTAGKGHLKETDQGLYWNKKLSTETGVDDILKIKFTLPTGGDWSDYKVFVWMTDDNTGAVDNGTTLTQEPDNIKIQYIYSFFKEDKLKFIHSKGASGRDYMTKSASVVAYQDGRIGTVGSPSVQYDWNNATSTGVAVNEDIRQSVHTVEYDMYVDPTLVIDGAAGEVKLLLPFQNYTGTGNNLEPTSYIRWYDYMTDLNTSLLKQVGTNLFAFDETLDNGSTRDRGWFNLDREQTSSDKATYGKIGVDFLGNQLKESQTAVIACDVSKYYDGVYAKSDGTGVLPIHEPTLSVRYIFTIRHSKVCADEVKAKADAFENAKTALASGTKYSSLKNTMFNLFEDNGRTVVALNGTQGEFSLRAKLADLSHYHIYTGSSTTGKCDGIDWYAYYEDEEGLWYCDPWSTGEKSVASSDKRIFDAQFSTLSKQYTLISDPTKKKTISEAKGAKIHLIGYLKSGSSQAAAIHYELCFIDAPAVPVLDLRNTEDADLLKRTDEYLKENLKTAGNVNFDKFDNDNKPTTWDENILQMPLEWSEAQYSFCYPDIDEYRQNNNWTGFSPQHGDYVLLKSMNLSGVSESSTDHRWYYGSTPTLRDYTYTYKHGDTDVDSDYGGFFYVDASDEARTMADLRFDAALCRGSEIHFTMAVADVTEGSKTAPQVVAHVYTAKDGKKDQLVMSFVACTLGSAMIKGGTKEQAKWYQYYGYGAIPSTVNLTGTSQSFIVEIDNNSKNTDGADFCVDQINFYTSTTKLKVKQSNYNCGDVDTKMNLYIDASDIESYTGQKIYWRVEDEDGNVITENASNTLYQNGGKDYGEVTIPSTLPSTIPGEMGTFTEGYFTGNDGVLYFSLANRGFDIEVGKQYFVSVYSLTAGAPSDESLWGNKNDACDVYSPVFMPKKMYLSVDDGAGNDKSTVSIGCGATTATVDVSVTLNLPDDTQVSGFKAYKSVRYDYFLGSIDDYNSYYLTQGGVKYYLSDALKNYRGKQDAELTVPINDEAFGFATTTFTTPPGMTHQAETSLVSAYATEKPELYAVIEKAITEGKLFLACSPIMSGIPISATSYTISALPVDDELTVTDNDGNPRKDASDNEIKSKVCTPLEFSFKVVAGTGGPSVVLGFEDVTTYPDAIRVVRVGKEQLTNMQKTTGGFLLHIPVNSYKTDESATANTGALKILGDLELLGYKSTADQTSDSKVGTANIDKVAIFEGTEISKTGNKMYVSLNFHGTGITPVEFREGFAYRMTFNVKKSDDTGCDATIEFLLKVVPEFVTWVGTTNNWNDDANWKRSERAELNKGAVTDAATANNHATPAHPNGYKNNSEMSISTTPNTFVPMKFSYVTIPTGLKAPNLANLGDAVTNGIYDDMKAGDGTTAATSNIQYDLMVRYTEITCKDHSVSGNVYDCEKFYGNWAKELYMKPNAELLNQQYLTYEKVWVEKELYANAWTLMSTPLQNTYAGDMYVPVSATAEDNGRQTSEAFQPINFSTTTNAAGFTYSRTKYPIYQKGWTQAGVFVQTKTNDVRATQYSANIPGGVSTLLNQWSHSYNDVTVPYSTWTAFAIRPHKKDQTAKTLIRLPKADTSYDYYQWDNTSPTDGKLTQDVSKTTTGKLLTDGTVDISGVTYGTKYGTTERSAGDGSFDALVSNIQSSPSNYQLVGNPYLCSIDMAAFISGNSANLETAGYWTYTNNNTGTALTTGTVGPMQSFFVKVKTGATKVIFTHAMMVDGTQIASPSREFTLTASSNRGQSAASVSVGEEEKSVETLFDSNLADVPMVYTVADGQAVSINQVKELSKPIAFGVTCTASNEMVDVTFSDIEQLTDGDVFVVDAVDGKTQQIYEGDTFSIQPNDYGRYFLTFAGGTTGVEEVADVQKGIVISVRGKEVIVTSTEGISQVRALSLNGATMYQDDACGTFTSFTLAGGVYIIKAENSVGKQQIAKIIVK
ncbi:hypothetical protein [Prevotella sp. tf2-5]|uniref:hypothetical protein n=1 Tax=Prevotella sp. tf2-5 TaxID=1761889 RepID=UPI0008E54369|nr:hypothetical protein [Prevotella sp. tf2-5]SFO47284.1 hypothetical protein SAMN04487852_101362 [Prevotella sp. tf2-5]